MRGHRGTRGATRASPIPPPPARRAEPRIAEQQQDRLIGRRRAVDPRLGAIVLRRIGVRRAACERHHGRSVPKREGDRGHVLRLQGVGQGRIPEEGRVVCALDLGCHDSRLAVHRGTAAQGSVRSPASVSRPRRGAHIESAAGSSVRLSPFGTSPCDAFRTARRGDSHRTGGDEGPGNEAGPSRVAHWGLDNSRGPITLRATVYDPLGTDRLRCWGQLTP